MAEDILYHNPEKYVKNLAEALKQSVLELKEPEWISFVKSGPSKERPIQEKDFWHIRSASILRQIYKNEIVGVGSLRTRYGSRKNRGVRPEEFRKAGGKIIRTILQQLEKAGLIEKAGGKRKGRKLTLKGKSFLEGIKI